ncbi:hypothetical protein BJV74DRAFT_796675 [Russula compacta]|nr:hypothetical protein BJV74DRAFT_796675 [Russula compacta]
MDPHRASNSSVFPLNSTLGPGHNIEHDNPTPRTSQNFDATWQWSGSGVTNNIWDPSQAQLPFVDNTSGVTPGPFHPSSSSSSRRPDLHGALPELALESQLPTSYPDPAQWPQNRNSSFHSCQLGFQYTTCSTSAQRSSPEAAGQFEVPEPPPKTSDNAKAFPNVLSEIYCPPPDATLPQFTSSAVLTAPSMQLGLPPPPRHIQEIFVAPDESPVSSFHFSLLPAKSNRQLKSPGDHAGRSSSHDQVPVVPPSPLGTQAPNEGAQGESQKHVSKRQKKKERDRERKHNERFNTSQDHEKICELLEVPLNPKKTLAQRSDSACCRGASGPA